jgi:hypothetical protein
VDFLNTKKAAVFCFVTGICLIAIGAYLTRGSSSFTGELNTRQAWYLITGIALSVSGVVQFMRDETV